MGFAGLHNLGFHRICSTWPWGKYIDINRWYPYIISTWLRHLSPLELEELVMYSVKTHQPPPAILRDASTESTSESDSSISQTATAPKEVGDEGGCSITWALGELFFMALRCSSSCFFGRDLAGLGFITAWSCCASLVLACAAVKIYHADSLNYSIYFKHRKS